MKALLLLLFCIQAETFASSTNSSLRIIGGSEATAGEFPFAAAIYKTTADGTYFCTGAILSNYWVITAGQCVDGATLFTILIGTRKLNGDDVTMQKLATSEYVLHPDYNPLTLENDIGLIKFRSSITFNAYIRKLYLPFSTIGTGSVGTALGWGQTTDFDSNLSNTLLRVNLAAVSDEQCKITYGAQIAENMICFEGNNNEGTCFGDSGSPIVSSIKGVYHVVNAISSFFSANGCESTDPSGYTRIYPYIEWIRSVTGVGLCCTG